MKNGPKDEERIKKANETLLMETGYSFKCILGKITLFLVLPVHSYQEVIL